MDEKNRSTFAQILDDLDVIDPNAAPAFLENPFRLNDDAVRLSVQAEKAMPKTAGRSGKKPDAERIEKREDIQGNCSRLSQTGLNLASSCAVEVAWETPKVLKPRQPARKQPDCHYPALIYDKKQTGKQR